MSLAEVAQPSAKSKQTALDRVRARPVGPTTPGDQRFAALDHICSPTLHNNPLLPFPPGAYTPNLTSTGPPSLKTFSRTNIVAGGTEPAGSALAIPTSPPVRLWKPDFNATRRERLDKWSFNFSDDDEEEAAFQPRRPAMPGGPASSQRSPMQSYNGSRPAAGASRPAGMVNVGNTCYLNAVLQTLFSLRTFTTDLMAPRLAALGLPATSVTCALQAAFTQFSAAQQRYSPTSLKAALAAVNPRWRDNR